MTSITTVPLTSVTVRMLTGDWTNASIHSALFGELVKRATVIERYHSDLFWDAQMVQQIEGPCEFYWMVRGNGTCWGEAAVNIERLLSTEPRELYHVAITQQRYNWLVTFTLLVKVTPGPHREPAALRQLVWESADTDEPGDQNAPSMLAPLSHWAIGPGRDGKWTAELIVRDDNLTEIPSAGVALGEFASEAQAKAAAQMHEWEAK